MTNANDYSTTGGLNLSLGFFVDYLVVGGGGGSGSGTVNVAYPSGGGGGAVLSGAAYQIQSQAYALTIGAGGAGGGLGNGVNGGTSSLFGVTAGGGIAPVLAHPGIGGASASGYAGGNRASGPPNGASGGGGGGDQGAGGNGIYVASPLTRTGGTGGIGTYSSITGSSLMYGFGGGGGAAGGNFQNGDGTTGTGARANSGGGGAGAGSNVAGANGTVIVSYQGAVAATGGTISSGTGSAAGSTVQTFTSSGAGSLDFSALDLNTRLGTTATGLISGSGNVAFNGPGRLTLTGNNTYTGTTTAAAGRLYVDGNESAATGTVTVNNGALVGGSGTIGGSTTVQSGGTLTPGDNAPGSLAFGSVLTLDSGSTLGIAIGGTTAGTTYSDGLVAGQLTLGGNLKVSRANGFNLAVGQKFFILDDSGNSSVSGTFSNTTDGGTLYTDSNGDTFYVDYTDSAGDGSAGNDVSLTVLTVPEPSVWALMSGAGLIVLTVLRRRHQVTRLGA